MARLVPILSAECVVSITRYIGFPSNYYRGVCTCHANWSDGDRDIVEALAVAHGARVIKAVA